MTNIDSIGKYFCCAGGLGDAFLFLSSFYDSVESANVVFLANNPNSIKELFELFPKLKLKLVLKNDFATLKEFYHHPNCIGTGHLPKNLDYSNWYKVDIFSEYGVKEFPDFMNIFPPERIASKQLTIQVGGSQVEGIQKQRMLTAETVKKVLWEFKDYAVQMIPLHNQPPLKQIISLIRGSDVAVGCDSFAKTISAMCGIRTIVYENIYAPEYLAKFKENIDYGHYIFLYPFSKIELRQQV